MPSAITLSSPWSLLSAVISKSGRLLLRRQKLKFPSRQTRSGKKKVYETKKIYKELLSDVWILSEAVAVLQYHARWHKAAYQQPAARSVTLHRTDTQTELGQDDMTRKCHFKRFSGTWSKQKYYNRIRAIDSESQKLWRSENPHAAGLRQKRAELRSSAFSA